MPRQISQCRAIVGRYKHLGLETPHPACRRRVAIHCPSADHLPHHRIKRQTICVIHILISGQPSENRLAQPTDQRVQTVVASSRAAQNSARNVVQARHLIQFPEQQQTADRSWSHGIPAAPRSAP